MDSLWVWPQECTMDTFWFWYAQSMWIFAQRVKYAFVIYTIYAIWTKLYALIEIYVDIIITNVYQLILCVTVCVSAVVYYALRTHKRFSILLQIPTINMTVFVKASEEYKYCQSELLCLGRFPLYKCPACFGQQHYVHVDGNVSIQHNYKVRLKNASTSCV